MVKFRVRLSSFVSCSIMDGPARTGISAIVRSAISCQRADENGIDGELCLVLKRQAIINDLNAPCIMDGHVDGGERNITVDARPGLLANTNDAFEG